jgi:hypothetical protein
VVLVQPPGSGAPPHLPAWVVVFVALTALILALSHWRFRTGWHMDERYGLGPKSREFVIMLGYISLPGAIGSASTLAMVLLGKLAFLTKNEWVGFFAMVLVVVALGSFVWMAKEWVKPTRRRTPDWLK